VKANVVRFATVVVGLVSITVALVDRIPPDIPAYAFGDASVLRAERGLALLAILFITFVVLWRGIAERELPIEISREGFKYQQREVTRGTEATLQQLEATVQDQDGAIGRLASMVDRTIGVVESQGIRLDRLEAGNRDAESDDSTST
jgi:hypothetical protein